MKISGVIAISCIGNTPLPPIYSQFSPKADGPSARPFGRRPETALRQLSNRLQPCYLNLPALTQRKIRSEYFSQDLQRFTLPAGLLSSACQGCFALCFLQSALCGCHQLRRHLVRDKRTKARRIWPIAANIRFHRRKEIPHIWTET